MRQLLELIGLDPDSYASRWPDELSGGQRQRVGVARALAADPPVLLMDEPFGALDPITRRQLQREFRRIQARVEKCVILVTHDMAEAHGPGRSHRRHGRRPPDLVSARRSRLSRATMHRFVRFWSRSCRFHGQVQHEGSRRLLAQPRQELATLVAEHVLLVVISTAVAVAIGVPLAIFATRRPRLAAPLVGVANIVQTIPSLAMFGFLLPVPLIGGVGARAALAVLVLYGLLPIVRSTIVGITSIDESIRLAGVAMGMTPRELLRQIELPLALPSIVAGIRVAAVVGVGSATIAAAIGAGGLGQHIYRGLSMVDSTVILAGAIPAALLALIVDGGLLWLERRLAARRRTRIAAQPRSLSPASLVLAVLAGSALFAAARAGRDRRRLEEFHRAADSRRDRRADDRARDGTAGRSGG